MAVNRGRAGLCLSPCKRHRKTLLHRPHPGASSGAASAYHYVVESDVLPAHEDGFNAWYDHEHLPGLAAVPGTVRAARYISAAGAPRYYACLDSLDTLGSAAWLAVRATTWSSRVRPGFCNTRRTMFSRASSAAAEPFARSD
jgi:hypothetical protein